MSDAREKAVERLAAIVLSAARSGHLHGSVSERIVAETYPDEWPQSVGWTRLVLDRLGLVAVPPELVEAVKKAEPVRIAPATEHTRARLALADAVLAQIGGKP